MLYLKEPNLIFVKSRKTAGTSVEIALSMSAQTGDIVTRLALPDELLRQKLGGPSAAEGLKMSLHGTLGDWGMAPALGGAKNYLAKMSRI